ncbi:MAG: hypothetical protein R3E86_18275 [Pseudomonadales bacterium]
MSSHPYCICTSVSQKALDALLEASGQGTYRDDHPWLVARDFLEAARQVGERLPVLFAVGTPGTFSHWGFIEALRVVELHRATWETACSFSRLKAVNPIWTDLDSVFLKPAGEQLEREAREGIRQHRYPLTVAELHPYAICETPAFILNETE